MGNRQRGAKRGARYRAKKTEVDGYRFDSKHEADRYCELRMLQRAGHIRRLELQVVFPIEIGGVPVTFDSGRQMKYIADFRYFDLKRRETVIEDAKGHRTEVYKIKKALMRAMGNIIEEV